jgi:hypothetical protein
MEHGTPLTERDVDGEETAKSVIAKLPRQAQIQHPGFDAQRPIAAFAFSITGLG